MQRSITGSSEDPAPVAVKLAIPQGVQENPRLGAPYMKPSMQRSETGSSEDPAPVTVKLAIPQGVPKNPHLGASLSQIR